MLSADAAQGGLLKESLLIPHNRKARGPHLVLRSRLVLMDVRVVSWFAIILRATSAFSASLR